MTINDATTLLIGHFIENDSLIEKNFNKFYTKKDIQEEVKACLYFSLSEMESKNIIKSSIIDTEDGQMKVWVLIKPIFFHEQLVQIDGQIAVAISNAVNSFFQSIGNNSTVSNPLNITKNDIAALLEILSMYAEQNLETGEKKESEK